MSDLLPQGMMETLLVEKIAVSYWRLRRLVRYETGELRSRLDEYKNDVIQNLNPDLVPSHTDPKALTHFSYDEEIPEEDFNKQLSLVKALTYPEVDLTTINYVLEYVICEYIGGQEGASAEDNLNSARQFITELSPKKKEELRAEILGQEWKVLGEMKQVRKMQAKFDQISRIRSIPCADELERIVKYETALERSILQNLAALQTLQKRRTKSKDMDE